MKPRYQPQIHKAQRKMNLQPEDVIPEWAIERSIAKRLLIDLLTLRNKRTPTTIEVMQEYRRRREHAKHLIWSKD